MDAMLEVCVKKKPVKSTVARLAAAEGMTPKEFIKYCLERSKKDIVDAALEEIEKDQNYIPPWVQWWLEKHRTLNTSKMNGARVHI